MDGMWGGAGGGGWRVRKGDMRVEECGGGGGGGGGRGGG